MTNKVWDEIINPFPKFNYAPVEVWQWKSNFIPYFTMGVITYPYWYLELIHISKRGRGGSFLNKKKYGIHE